MSQTCIPRSDNFTRASAVVVVVVVSQHSKGPHNFATQGPPILKISLPSTSLEKHHIVEEATTNNKRTAIDIANTPAKALRPYRYFDSMMTENCNTHSHCSLLIRENNLQCAPAIVATTGTNRSTSSVSSHSSSSPSTSLPLAPPRPAMPVPNRPQPPQRQTSRTRSVLFDTQDLLQQHLFQSEMTTKNTTHDDELLLKEIIQTGEASSSFHGNGGETLLSSPVTEAASTLVDLTSTTTSTKTTNALSTTTWTPNNSSSNNNNMPTTMFASSGAFSTMSFLPTTTTQSLFSSNAWAKALQPTHVDVEYDTKKIFPETQQPTATSSSATTAHATAVRATTTTTTAVDYLNLFLNQLPQPVGAAVPHQAPVSSSRPGIPVNDVNTALEVGKQHASNMKSTCGALLQNDTSPLSVNQQQALSLSLVTPDDESQAAAAAAALLSASSSSRNSAKTDDTTPTLNVPSAAVGTSQTKPHAVLERPTTAKAKSTAATAATMLNHDEGIDGDGNRIIIIPWDQVTNLDVLMGRGGRTNHHPGNIRYLQEKLRLQPRYMAALKDDKTPIAQELVDAIVNQGGRFLKNHGSSKSKTHKPKQQPWDDGSNRHTQWYQVDNITARKKASQTLREINTAEVRAAKRERYNPTPASSKKKRK